MKITRLEACDAFPVAMQGSEGATKQVPIGRQDGAPHFSIRVFTLQPGGHTPHHSHESEHLTTSWKEVEKSSTERRRKR